MHHFVLLSFLPSAQNIDMMAGVRQLHWTLRLILEIEFMTRIRKQKRQNKPGPFRVTVPP